MDSVLYFWIHINLYLSLSTPQSTEDSGMPREERNPSPCVDQKGGKRWKNININFLFWSFPFLPLLFIFLLFRQDLMYARLALYVFKNDLYFPTLPYLIYAVPEMKPRASCMLEKYSTDWDTVPPIINFFSWNLYDTPVSQFYHLAEWG